MLHDRSNELYVPYRHSELLTESERERLAIAVSRERHWLRLKGMYRPALTWFGRILTETGRRLYERSQISQTDSAALP